MTTLQFDTHTHAMHATMHLFVVVFDSPFFQLNGVICVISSLTEQSPFWPLPIELSDLPPVVPAPLLEEQWREWTASVCTA